MTEDNAHLEKVKQSLDPSFLEQYELVKMLGSGAMGMVIEARQIELDRPVAIKFVIENNSLQTELWKRFNRAKRKPWQGCATQIFAPFLTMAFPMNTIPRY